MLFSPWVSFDLVGEFGILARNRLFRTAAQKNDMVEADAKQGV